MGLLGSLFSSKSSSTASTANNDNRQVNDSGGGDLVSGSGNNITDGGAFAIVDKLVSNLGAVAQAQTSVARDIALRDTAQGSIYAQRAVEAQEAAAAASADTFNKTAVAIAVAGLVVLYVLKRRK
ncbi:hypothetical protein EYS42_08775 [Aquabacterium lacunae]|uniref:Uncharacterized protein n=1 Tax=Aquabacterium lacunae TaxID=2528630 RepID=A0A4V2JFP1_9BURK|nr:hypothetical protein [Aquabacterium lacunae]TBO31328.1 hypothetical protein EYS42_08775 [Aquabacterium lacunae]